MRKGGAEVGMIVMAAYMNTRGSLAIEVSSRLLSGSVASLFGCHNSSVSSFVSPSLHDRIGKQVPVVMAKGERADSI